MTRGTQLTRCEGGTHSLRLPRTLAGSWLRGSEMRPSAWGQRRRFSRPLGIVLTVATLLFVGAAIDLLRSQASTISGRPTVVDCDTIRFGERRVRLTGLDAPELDQS